LISFFPSIPSSRVTPIPSFDQISTTATSSSSSHYLFFLFFVSFSVRRVFPFRFIFVFGSSPDGLTAPISLCPTEGIVSPPLRAGCRGKVRESPQGRSREANSRARRRSSSRSSFDAAAVLSSAFFISLARVFFSFSFPVSSSFTSVTNIYSTSCPSDVGSPRAVPYEIVRFAF